MKTPRQGAVLSAIGAVVLVVLVVDLRDTDDAFVYVVSGIAAGLSLLGRATVGSTLRAAAEAGLGPAGGSLRPCRRFGEEGGPRGKHGFPRV